MSIDHVESGEARSREVRICVIGRNIPNGIRCRTTIPT
jgi:hypothetical protein